MNTISKKLSDRFGRNLPESSNSPLPASRSPQQSMLLDGSETATRGQLVQVLLRDLIRKSGMPPDWLQCQIQVMNSRSRGQGIYLRLIVKHWDERLMRYAFAFQKALLTEIIQFEPKAESWLQGIAWQLELATNCPLTELPPPQFWQVRVVSVAGAEPIDPFDPFEITPLPSNAVIAAVEAQAASDDTAQDLERLFAIRDNELANTAANNLLPAGYESTEPSPLQIR